VEETDSEEVSQYGMNDKVSGVREQMGKGHRY